MISRFSSISVVFKPVLNLISLIGLSLLFACRTQTVVPHAKELSGKPRLDRTPVVFVPGITGSVLKDRAGNVVWLKGSQALGFSTPDLRLLGEQSQLEPAGAVARVTAIPYLIDAEIYGTWLEEMNSDESLDFSVFSYDWRKDNLNTRDQLIQTLETIQKTYKKKPILIGHSMGGMLSFSAANSRPDLIEKLVVVGVPFRGGIGYMKNLHKGNRIGLNSKIQSPCVVAKYQSVYGFFPRLGTWDSKDVVLDKEGKPVELNFFQASTWKDNQLGIYNQNCSAEETPNAEELQTLLNRALQFRASLDPSPGFLKNHPPMLVVHANNRNCRKAIQEVESDIVGRKKWDIEKAPKVLGDGSVSYENSTPPPNTKYETQLTEYEHTVMLNDPKVYQRIKSWIKP